MIDEDVIERVLGTALRTGGDFAEVFAEDKRSSSAVLDDGKVEELSSGRDRGAGIRVVVGDTTGFAHTADLTEAGLLAAAEAAAAAARGGGGGTSTVALTRRTRARAQRGRDRYPEDVAKATQGRAAHHGPTRPPARPGRAITPGRRPATATAAGASSSPTATACSPTTTRSARCSRCRAWPPATPACRPAASRSATPSASSCSTATTSRSSPARPPTGRSPSSTPARRPAAQMPVVIGPGGGGVLFHEACGHGLEADLVGKGASVFAGRVGEQVASAAASPSSTTAPWPTSGAASPSTTRATPPSATCSSRTASSPTTCGTSSGPARRAAQSSGNGRRQSYQHLPMVRMTNTYLLGRRRRPRRHRRLHRPAASTWRTSAAARSTPPPATSCSA